MPVNSERKDYQSKLSKWKRLRDCEGGRDAVLAAGNAYVPDLPGADLTGNTSYRQRGNFYNAVSRTVQGMNGVVFQKPPIVEFPESFQDYLKDISLTNVSFEMFATSAGKEIMLVGRYGVLIDMPQVLSANNRPYCVGYKAEDIINWRTERMGGDEVLSMVVLRETVEIEVQPDPTATTPVIHDQFSYEIATQFRVVWLRDKKCVQQLWRKKNKDAQNFDMHGDEISMIRRGISLDFVPFVFLGSTHATPDLENPPLIDLADVNLGHWRNSVDHEYGLHLVALPTPWVSGSKALPPGEKMKIGPSVVWDLELQGSAGMLEFSGSGLGSLVIAMEEKKKQMASLGARLLEDATPNETATVGRMRHSGEHASLRTMAGSIELGFTLVLQIFAWWAGIDARPVDTKVKVELNKEYLNIKASAQEVQVALTMLQSGEISYETWYAFIQTGGWAREGIDAATERKAISEDAVRSGPELDPEPEPEPKRVKKTVKDALGNVKYEIEEETT